MTEKIFVNKILKKLNELGYFWKTHGSIYSAGKADIVGLINGDFIAVEAKVIKLPSKDSTIIPLKSKLVTKAQQQFLEEVQKNKGLAFIFVGVDGSKGGIIFEPPKLRDLTTAEFKSAMILDMFKTAETVVKK